MATPAFTENWHDQTTRGAGDLRPILPRTSDNAWERTEQLRAALHAEIERLCLERGIRALVLQSPPYIAPAWVKFETWSPRGEPCLTARAAFTIQLHTLPHHSFETLYTVEWERHGSRRSLAQLHDLGETHLHDLLDLLMDAGEEGPVHRRIRRLLRPLQIRQQWWQLLRPANRVTTVRRDWAAVGSVTVLVLGLWLLVVAAGESSPDSEPAGVAGSYDLGGEATVPSAGSVSGLADSLSAASLVPLDGAGTATLEPGGATLDDGRYYHARGLHLSDARRVEVTLRSGAFDTVLMIGRLGVDGYEPLAVNDDGGADDTNSRIAIDLDPGEYVVLFTTYATEQSGPYGYTLTIH